MVLGVGNANSGPHACVAGTSLSHLLGLKIVYLRRFDSIGKFVVQKPRLKADKNTKILLRA